VLLTAYEWRRASAAVPEGTVHMHNTQWADQAEIEALATHYDTRMGEAGFFYPDHKAANMRQTLRNFWSRMPLTQADTRLLHGILRQMVRWKDRGGGDA
jgi:tRNA/rRNA methyltransferase